MKDKNSVFFSKSIIGYHYEKLGIIWLFQLHFAEKCVTLGQGFYSKFFCFPCGKASFSYQWCTYRLKETSFYYAEELFSDLGINICEKAASNLSKNSHQILILCEKKNFEKPYCTNQTLLRKSPSAIKDIGLWD